MLRSILQTVQNLSIDVVLGAVISSMFIAEFLSVQVPASQLLALGLAVWLIYTADHLTDARAIPHAAHSSRHRFHQQYFKALLSAWIILAIFGISLLTLLPQALIIKGGFMVILVAIYFLLIRILPHLSFLHKELMIAILYSFGVFLTPVNLYPAPFGSQLILLFLQYCSLALLNVMLISWYERDTDQKDGLQSFIVKAGSKKGVYIIKICLFCLYLSIAVSFWLFGAADVLIYAQAVILLMTLTLHAVAYFQALFSKKKRYRIWSDAVFMYPVIYLLIC